MDVFALVAVCVTTFFFLGAALNAADLYMSVRHITADDLAKGCLGWFTATFGPIGLVVVFWRCTKILRRAWMLHLLMLPFTLAMFKAGSALMLSVIGSPDFDDTLGGPVLQGIALLLLAVIGYYSAVLYTAWTRGTTAANGS